MPATASTRTATRWSSREAARGIAIAAYLAATACISRTSVFFLPTPGQERIGQTQLRERADALVRLECPRLMGTSQAATGAVDFRLTVDRSGDVTRADVARSSRDHRIDGFFGGLVAQLHFDPPQNMTAETTIAIMMMGYSCSPTVQVATVELKQQ